LRLSMPLSQLGLYKSIWQIVKETVPLLIQTL
jgi:hypothetical protein